MKLLATVASLLLATLLGQVAAAATPDWNRQAASRSGARSVDIAGWLAGADVGMFNTNVGGFAFDMSFMQSWGLEFPLGSGTGVVFASGIWLGAMVAGSPRVTVSEYSSEFLPGIAPAAIPENPSAPELYVYKLSRTYGSTAARDAALQAYQANAVPRGAPSVQVLGDGSLSILGDQMTYSVFNDLDASAHTAPPGSTSPLQVEVRHTSWAYNRPGPIGRSLFMRFTILNRGASLLQGMHVAFWVDPDVGQYDDDRVGCDIGRSLAYGYNANNSDPVFGSSPPAVGYDLLQGPWNAALGRRMPMTALVRYTTGTIPYSAVESYRVMRGLTVTGASIKDPSNVTTKFMHSGDPVAGTGWVDVSSLDQRFLMSSGPFDMASGQTQDIVLAILVARGTDRLTSVTLLKQASDQVQAAFDANQLDLLDTPALAPPARLMFSGARPNPSRGDGSVTFSLPRESDVTLEVLDLAGRRVASARWDALPAGVNSRPLPAGVRGLPAGMYVLRLSAGAEHATQRWVALP